MVCFRKRLNSKYQLMGLEESRWKATVFLWIFIFFSGAFIFFINIFQMQYNCNVIQPTIMYELNPQKFQTENVDMKGFLLKTKGCRMPEMQPLDPSVKHCIFEEKPVICKKGVPALVKSNLTSLTILKDSFPAYDINDTSLLKCCYTPFWRVDPAGTATDGQVRYGKSCVYFNDSVYIDEEFVMVKCLYNTSSIYKDYFPFVPVKSTLPEVNDVNQKLNVLIFGIDSISRLNFHRQMPKTLAQLNALKAVELLGYNKVGDNTFPNLMPILTGLNEDELKKTCWPETTTHFDACPFIWENFNETGYATLFGEDASWMGIFNYQKRGFKRQPTHYYYDTFDREATKQIGNNHRVNVHQCIGSREAYKLLLDYAERFVRIMTNARKPFFGFFWSSSLSHDLLNKPKLGDDAFQGFVMRLQRDGLLRNTVFIFLSDHGIRWGDIRYTFQGRIEERLPFIYIYLPKWYREQYNLAYSNLARNSRRLTTPYDLHKTLVDLIDPYVLTRDVLKRRQENTTARRDYSLFEAISQDRTCKEAYISPHWCTCQESVKINSSDPVIIEAANFTVSFINNLLVGYADCATLELEEIIDSHLQTHHEDILKQHSDQDYILTLKTKPSDALFEATVRRKRNQNQYVYEIIGTISRINLYGQQSLCMTDFHLKLYCFCKHLL